MRRVVVTGMGIVSSIGSNTQEVTASLHDGKSGITRADRQAELGFRSQVHGAPTLRAEEIIDRRAMRFHGGGTAWNHVAMDQAIVDSGLAPDEVSNERTGIIMGSGGPSTRAIVESADTARAKGPKRVGPFAVPKSMSSTASATLSTWFKIKGISYSISSACATSNHCIGAAPGQSAECDVRRWMRGTRLDFVGDVRRDGGALVCLQRHAFACVARLRQRSGRICYFGRRRRFGA
jgi:3-oxoacyl-[acyl-carrier-protein] synthase-1